MIHSAEVFLWGTRIGVVSANDSDAASFQYDKNFLTSKIELSPLAMPLGPQVYSFPTLNKESFKGLPGLLSDSLPDYFGDEIVKEFLRSEGRSLDSLTPIERLCYTGKRGMGALEFVPANGPRDDENETLDIEKMSKLASDVLSKREDLAIRKEDATAASLLKFGTSAGGARAKAIIAIDKKSGEICSGQIANKKDYSYWIIKFDEVENNGDYGLVDPKGFTRVEYAYFLMATDCGIKMNECRLYELNGKSHFMTKRFDRDENSGDKIHMQTLAALAHLDYKTPRVCSYEKLVQICYMIGLGQNEIEQIFRRMVFNCLAVNCDDHVKNVSFLMDKSGRWKLAPAYDLTFSYNPDSFWVSEHQMTVNQKSKEINSHDMLAAASFMNISEAKARLIIGEVKETLSCWPDYASAAGVKQGFIDSIGKMIADNLVL